MSNPDKDFPNDPDRFTPLQDVPDLQDPEVMPDPVMDRHLTSWAQQVEAESAAAGHEEKPFSLPWPPLSQEQVVELHDALNAWMESVRLDGSLPSRLRDHALHSALTRLNIGTPQPPPRQEENLGGFACLDERRMGPEVKRNCWTCEHNKGLSNYCVLMSSRFERSDVEAWIQKQAMSDRGSEHPNMPSKDSDGCPGWTPKS